MFDSRSSHPRCRVPGFPASQHMGRYNDTWMVQGVEVAHPSKPAPTKVEAIAEGLDFALDIADMASIAVDGITGLPPMPERMTCTWKNEWHEDYGYYDCCHECACGCTAYYQGYAAEALVEAMFPTVSVYDHLTPKVPGAVVTSQSDDYDVRVVNERVTRANARKIAAKVEAAQAAKRVRPSGQPAQYGSLIQVSTRQRTRR